MNITPHQRSSDHDGDGGLGRTSNKRKEAGAEEPLRSAVLVTGKEERELAARCSCSVGGWATRGGTEEEKKAGGRKDGPIGAVTSSSVFG